MRKVTIVVSSVLLLLVSSLAMAPVTVSAYNPPPITDAPDSWYIPGIITLLPTPSGYGGSVSDCIAGRGDRDVFRFEVSVLGDLIVNIKAPKTMSTGGANPRLAVELYGTNYPSYWLTQEVPIATSGDLGPVILWAGIYWLRVREHDDAGWDNGESIDPYNLTVSYTPMSTGNDRAPESWYRATLIPPTKVCTDTIARKNDRDIWRFDVTSSGTLQINVTAPATMRTDAANPRIVVEILGTNYPSLIVSGEVAVGSTGTVSAPGTVAIGTYWLRAYERDAGGYDRGESPSPYTLLITGNATIVPDAVPIVGDIGKWDAYTTDYYSIGATITDSITPVGDHDWYKFPVGVLGELNVNITGPTTGSGIRVRLYNPDGGYMTLLDVAMGSTGILGLVPVWDWTYGGYFLQVTEYDADGENNEVTGPYTLKINLTPAPGGNDVAADWYLARLIDIGESASNTIQPKGDQDYYAFELPSVASQYEVRILCTAPASMRTGGLSPKAKLLLYGANYPSYITTASVDVGTSGQLGPIILGPGLHWIIVREVDSLGENNGESNDAYTIRVVYRLGRSSVSMKLDKLAYKPGDPMDSVLHVENAGTTSLTLEWRLAVPQKGIIKLWLSATIPAGFATDVPYSILVVGNWGPTPFYGIWVLILKDASGNIIAWDTTYWTYGPP